MKKWMALLSTALMLVVTLAGCAQISDTKTDYKDKEEKLSIITTIFPEYDWTRQILGSNSQDVELTMLLDSGIDLHSYQPTVNDIIQISACDMFIYVGGESAEWVENALQEAKNKEMVVINLLDVLGDTVKEEVKEGMEAEENHERAHEEGKNHEEEEPEFDEHVWLSLKNAETLCNYICDKLCTIDSKNASDYKSNTKKYTASLTALDAEYRQTVHAAKHKTLLFGDRFPFRYMAEDYGLEYYAAFPGCSAETEASFETIAFLAGKVDELGLSSILAIEGTEHKIAETIIENTKTRSQQIVIMDSMQSITSQDATSGTTYLSVMTANLEALKTALN